MCPTDFPSQLDPITLPTNASLLKLIEFRKNERIALTKMKVYEMENPKFFKKIEEKV